MQCESDSANETNANQETAQRMSLAADNPQAMDEQRYMAKMTTSERACEMSRFSFSSKVKCTCGSLPSWKTASRAKLAAAEKTILNGGKFL